MKKDTVKNLFDFIEKSPTAYHTAENACALLSENGYTRLYEQDKWNISPGGKYYVCRGMSSVIAFTYPKKDFNGFSVIAPHGDSPCFKIKESPEIKVEGRYTKLNTEVYGGMTLNLWTDRPLSAAGRLMTRDGEKVKAQLIDIKDELLIIPGIAIHMNREANSGAKTDPSKDTLPLLGLGEVDFLSIVAKRAGVKKENILSFDLYAYNPARGMVVGAGKEFISAPKLDDLECVYSALTAFIQSENSENVKICAVFDSEEIGSMTRQGADSTFLRDVMERLCELDGKSREDALRAMAKSFMVSADNAHGVHPNYPEKTDPTNRCYLNGGIVIKHSPSYTTDGITAALFMKICENAGVPVQSFYNRSDMRGGSTLGNISNTHVSMPSVDIGLAQLSMHSPYETGGKDDLSHMIKGMTEFYNSVISCEKDGEYTLLK